MTADIAFETLIEQMADACLLVDVHSHTIVYANTAACDLLGYDLAALAAMSPADIHPHEIPRLNTFLDQVLNEGSWASDALSCRARSGVKIPADVRATRIEFDGQSHVFIIVRDLRGERLAQLGQSVRQLAHDLRNTLGTAQLVADRLARHEDSSMRRSAELLARSVERALAMCSNAIMTGRTSAPQPDIMRFLLVDLIEDLQNTVRPKNPEAIGIEAGPGAETIVAADYDQLYRLVLNLARNAFAAGALRVTVSAADPSRDQDSGTTIFIEDDGPGLPQQVSAELFEEKRWRSDAGGLGLSIASEIAAAHGGELALVSSSSEGACFSLSLPR